MYVYMKHVCVLTGVCSPGKHCWREAASLRAFCPILMYLWICATAMAAEG